MKKQILTLLFLTLTPIYSQVQQGSPPTEAQTGTPVVTLAWDRNDASENVVEYRVYYGEQSGIFNQFVSAGNEITKVIDGLTKNTTYYFVVTAINEAGLESLPSNEVSTTIPDIVAPNSPTNVRIIINITVE